MLSIGNLVFNSLDYILIVDRNYNILFNTRYDARVSHDDTGEHPIEDVSNKNFFMVYPKQDRKNSSVSRCMETGEVVVRKNQVYSDYLGRTYTTSNVTVPIRRKDQIVAVVELVKDVDPLENLDTDEKDKAFDEFVEAIRRESGSINFDTIITRDSRMLKNIQVAKILSRLPDPVLIHGETGTGKEVFVQSMISYSDIPRKKVVVQNCAAIPENLIESILFGTERGAYTGAERRKGLFEEADGGILFLDELNSIPYHVQSKLLRVLQDGTFRPLGADRDKRVSVKVIGAVNVDPVAAMENKELRKDLFYRFSGGIIELPPLRDRRSDIKLFVEYYIKYFAEMYRKDVNGITRELREMLLEHHWEGNVRELKNAMELMIKCLEEDEKLLDINHLPGYLKTLWENGKTAPGRGEGSDESGSIEVTAGMGMEDPFVSKRALADDNGAVQDTAVKRYPLDGETVPNGNAGDIETLLARLAGREQLENADGTIDFDEILAGVEKVLIEKALAKASMNKTRAGKLLGLPRQTLKYKMERLNL